MVKLERVTHIRAFNTPLEMRNSLCGSAPSMLYSPFQYSVGDAGASCPCFLRLFKFLCRRVWVSCGACWLWLFWFCFLCWRAEKRGVGVCVFFSSASVCAEELHDVL